MKKRCNRRHVLALPPRGLRPKLRPQDLTKVGLCHVENLDAIAKGEADEQLLWDFCEGVFTWSRVATHLGRGELEMTGQIEVAVRLIDRWSRTGAVRFDDQDYQMAKWGVAIMDTLAAEVDTATAAQAAMESTLALAQLQDQAAQLRAQAAKQEARAA